MDHDVLVPPVFTSKSQCIGAFIFVLELVSTAVCFVLYAIASVHRSLLLLNCLVAIASIFSGFLGVWRSTPATVASFMVAIGSTFGFALLGGLCLLFTLTIDVDVATFLSNAHIQRNVESREKLMNNTNYLLKLASAVLVVNALVHLSYSWVLQQRMGERRAAIAFLQTFSIIMCPLSLFLILGGSYIVDTRILASAPYAGFAIFTSGVLLLLVSLLAFIGGNFEYRRLLSLCYLISALIGTCSVILATICLIERTFVEDNISSNFESIRSLLPPTSQIVYDRDRFAAVVRTNLCSVAYTSLLAGIFVLLVAAASYKLIRHASTWKSQVAREKKSMKDFKQTAIISDPVDGTRSTFCLEGSRSMIQQWINHFENSTRRQRIVMRIIVVLTALAIMLMFAGMCANVILTIKCNSIGSQIASTTFPILNSTSNAQTNVIRLTNTFSRGEVIVLPTNSTMGSVEFDYYSFKEKAVKVSDMYNKVISNETISISIWPMDASLFSWLDGSCQRLMMIIEIPQDPLQCLVINSSTSVVVNAPETIKFRGLSIFTVQSNVVCSNLKIYGDELRIESATGDINIDHVTIDASKSLLVAEKRVTIFSALGFVSVSKVVLSQCDLQVRTRASTLFLSDIQSSVNTGRSHIEAESLSARISVDDLHANWVTLKSEAGDVYGSDILIEGNSAFMGRLEVATVTGDIQLDNIIASGIVYIESASGKISVQLKSQTFTGMYYLRSTYGAISIRQTNFSNDVIVEDANSSDGLEKRGSINCNTEATNCLAFGNIYLRSNFGDIDIVLGCESFSCS
ncbi:putative adhesin [Plasmopara halstedii]